MPLEPHMQGFSIFTDINDVKPSIGQYVFVLDSEHRLAICPREEDDTYLDESGFEFNVTHWIGVQTVLDMISNCQDYHDMEESK